MMADLMIQRDVGRCPDPLNPFLKEGIENPKNF